MFRSRTVTQENCHEKIHDDKLVNEESSHVGAASLRIFPTDRCGPLETREYFFLTDVNLILKKVKELSIKDKEHVGAHHDLEEWDVIGLHDKTLEAMFEDFNDSHEVFEDDENECDDAQAGKLSACAEKLLHNVVTQIREEMLDNNAMTG